MQFVDVDNLWKSRREENAWSFKTVSGNPRHRILKIGIGNKIYIIFFHMGGIGEVEIGGVLLPMYPQESLPPLTLSSFDSFEVIFKGNTFLVLLFWRKLTKEDLLIKFRAVLHKVCFRWLWPARCCWKRSLWPNKFETHSTNFSFSWRFTKYMVY